MCNELIQLFANDPMYREAAERLRKYNDATDSMPLEEFLEFMARQDIAQINADRALLADLASRLLLECPSNGN